MGTRFRTLLAPIGVSTGDSRRFAEGSVTLPSMPMPFEWVREREDGHDGAVTIGAVHKAHVGTVAEALANGWISPERAAGLNAGMSGVWASGEFFDDADRETMPRLAEDVATAMHLIENGTLGPSVDPDSFEGVPVLAGSDEVLTEQAYEDAYRATGQEPKVELLVTAARIRAATLVSIPAFEETSRPLELIPVDSLAASEDGRTINTHCVNCGDTRGGPVGHEISECTWDSRVAALALIASVSTLERPAADAFDGPALTRPTPITYDYETGRVYGHIATWSTCHAGYPGMCVTAPRAQDGYAAFNRHPVETADGVIWAGRITAGGRHAGLSLAADATMRVYDEKETVAWVRAYEDQFGIAVAGVLVDDIGEGEKAILSRRKVSGDWRETSHGLSLVEVLALSPGPRAHSEPGFPVETFSWAGRQVALVASLSPDPGPEREDPEIKIDIQAVVATELARREAGAALAALVKQETNARRGALLAALNGEA